MLHYHSPLAAIWQWQLVMSDRSVDPSELLPEVVVKKEEDIVDLIAPVGFLELSKKGK